MFISKPVLVILFFLAIGSTAGFLYLLSARTVAPQATPVATNTVLVSPSFAPSSAAIESTVASSGALASNAEWKSYTSTSLSMKVEYPAGWVMDATESATIRITSPMSGTASATTTLTFAREKKSSTSSKLTDFVKKQSEEYKKGGYTSGDGVNYSIAEYDGTEVMYTKENELIREIVYPTKNYFYIVRISPGKNDHKAVIDEILKSVKIV